MTYEEYCEQRQREVNALPLFFAFSSEQFAEAMQERGLTVDDTDKIYQLHAGCFYLRSDADTIREYFHRPDRLKELMADPEFAENAFYSEMANHEYAINWQGDWDVCECFGSCEYGEDKSGYDYLAEMGYAEEVKMAWFRARTRYLRDAEENEWF